MPQYDPTRPYIDQMAGKFGQPRGDTAGPTRGPVGMRPGANQALVDYIRKRKAGLVGGGAGGPVGQVGGRPFGGSATTAGGIRGGGATGSSFMAGGNIGAAGGAMGAAGGSTGPMGGRVGDWSDPRNIAGWNQLQKQQQQSQAGGAQAYA